MDGIAKAGLDIDMAAKAGVFEGVRDEDNQHVGQR